MSTATAAIPAQLRLATFDDYEQIVRVESSNQLGSLHRQDWQNLWLKNPLWPRVEHDWQIGWVLENAEGRVVGSLINVPSLYTFRGQQLLCANGRGWAVEPEYRPFALALMGEYFGQSNVDLFINTTVGPNAAPIISTLSDRIPQGDFQSTAYFALYYRELAEKALRRKRVPLASMLAYPAAAVLRCKDAWRRRALKPAPSSFSIECVDDFDARFDDFWAELASQNSDKLLAVRNRAALAWHFAIPQRKGDLRIFTASRVGKLRAYCIVKRQDAGEGVSRMRVVDFQTVEPNIDLLAGLLKVALRRCAKDGIRVLEHLGVGLPKMRTFDRFAPYRRTLACWPFYYRAVDPTLDAELSTPDFWDASVFDGDASFE